MKSSASRRAQTLNKTHTLRPHEVIAAKTAQNLSKAPRRDTAQRSPGARRVRARPRFLQQLSSSCRRLSLTLVEVMSIMTSWKAAVSSACRWVCSAIFSLNFRGLDAPEPAPEAGPGPQPPEPVADIFTERTGRADVVERFQRGAG